MTRFPRARAGGLLLAVSLLSLGPLAGGSAAAAGDYPRILQVRSDQRSTVSLDVVVPPILAEETLPLSAFRVSENGRRSVVTSAARLPVAGLRVLLVIDTAVPRAVLDAEQGAAREFLFALPRGVRAGVVAGGPDPELAAAAGTDRTAAVRALAELRPQPPDGAVDITPSIDLALGQLQPHGVADFVIVVDSRPTLTTVPYDLSRTVTGSRTTLYSVLLGRGAAGYLGGLPQLSGGRVLEISRPSMLVNAFDTVRSELLGRYRVGYLATGAPGQRAQLLVVARGVQAVATFAVGAVPAKVPPLPGDNRPLPLLLALLVGIAVVAVLVGRVSTPPPAGQGTSVTGASATSPPTTRTAASPAPPGVSARTRQLPGAAKNR